jgi:hypothetical protein
MKVKGQLQWTDYLSSQLLHMQPSRLVRILLYGVLAVVGCYFIGGLYLFATGQSKFPLSAFLLIFVFVELFLLYRYVMLPNQVKKIFFRKKELGMPFELEFTDTGLVASYESGTSTRPWGNFIRWKENKDLLMLYHSDVKYSIIPKRFFIDPQQIETVKAYLKKNDVPTTKKRSMTR